MSLRNTFDRTNMTLSRGLSLRYRTRLDGAYYIVTRYATKEYSFRGMKLSAALACRDAMKAKYTRLRVRTAFNADGSYSLIEESVPMASVTPSNTGGGTWSVSIAVNEEDSRYVKSVPSDPATLFSAENLRDYDEIYPIEIVGVERESGSTAFYLTLRFNAAVKMTLESFLAFVTYGSGSDWNQVAVERVNPAVDNVIRVRPTYGDVTRIRVSAGNLDSNVAIVA